MYTKEINPIIDIADYHTIKSIIGSRRFADQHMLCTSRITYDFIQILRRYYKMKDIAKILGVSVRHLYRILNQVTDFSKNDQIKILIANLTYAYNYSLFLVDCYNHGIHVRGE